MPRLDLRQALDKHIANNPAVQTLSDTIRNLDLMVVEDDQWAEIFEAWLASNAPTSVVVTASVGAHSFERELGFQYNEGYLEEGYDLSSYQSVQMQLSDALEVCAANPGNVAPLSALLLAATNINYQ